VYDFLSFWNVIVFALMRGTSESPHALVLASQWLAEVPAYVASVLVLAYIIRKRDYSCVVAVAAACVASRFVKDSISDFAFHTRPFDAGWGPSLIEHASSHSMPSSHATFVWLLAVVCGLRGQWRLSFAVFLLGCVLAWARVFVGVHWPMDMVGAALSALACGLFGHGVQQICTRLYGKAELAWGYRPK